MTITLSQNTSDKKRVSKDIRVLTTLENVKLLNDFNILHPILKVSRETYANFYNSCNYCYIPDFHRFYFLRAEIESNFVYLYCDVDVRVTYADALKKTTATVTRNEFEKNGYLHDSNYSVYAYEQIVCKMFPNSINQDSIILMTVG